MKRVWPTRSCVFTSKFRFQRYLVADQGSAHSAYSYRPTSATRSLEIRNALDPKPITIRIRHMIRQHRLCVVKILGLIQNISHVEVRRCCPWVNAPWVLQARSIISYSEHLYHGKDSVIRTGMCRSSYSGSLHGSQQTLTSIQAVDTPGLHQVAAGQTHMNLSLMMGVKRP